MTKATYICGSRAYGDGGYGSKKPYSGRIGIQVSLNQQNEGVRGGHQYGGHGNSFVAIMEDTEVTNEKKWFATPQPKDTISDQQHSVKDENE